MITRRLMLAATIATAAMGAASYAAAEDWKTKYPELTFALVPSENAADTTARWAPMMDYLSKQIGVKVNLRIVNDYAAVIEGQKAGNIQIALYGPASYARAFKVGAEVTPFAIEVSKSAGKGYYSVLLVKKDSPYQKIDDLKGKPVAFVDPNSTSGNNVPRFEMNKLGLDADKFFSKVVYSGTHENAVLALQQGTVEAAFNSWDSETSSNLMKMETKGMAKYSDYRIIMKSTQIVNSPVAYLNGLPEDLKTAIRNAFLNAYKNDQAAFDKVYDGKYLSWEPVTHDAYKPVVDLITFVDELKKKS